MSGEYYTPPRRPTILTAVGVTSIIIGSISLIASFFTFSFAGILIGMTAIATTMNSAIHPVAATQPFVEYVSASGLGADQRKIVIEGLNDAHAISAIRREQLDELLADAGQNIIQLSTDNLTAKRITDYVTDASEISGATGGAMNDVLTLGSGRLQISDIGATFFPADNSAPTRSRLGSYTDADGVHLGAREIGAVVKRVVQLSSASPNTAQINALESTLESPSQTLIAPCRSPGEAAAQVISVQSMGEGTIAVTTSRGPMSFGSTGQAFPGVMAVNAFQTPPWMTGPHASQRAVSMLQLDALAGLAAGGFLLACGIMALRNAPPSRWMHLAYAAGKILIVGFSCWAVYTVARELAAKSGDAREIAMVWMICASGVGWIYPIVLLIVMNLRSVKEFLGVPTVARIF